MAFFFLFFVFPVCVVLAGIGDFFTLKIPNVLNGILLLLFIPAAFFLHLSFEDLLWHALAGGVVLVGGFFLYAFGFLGGGDAKLFAVVACWIGWSFLLPFFVYTSLAGAVLAGCVLFFRVTFFPYAPFLPLWAQQYYNPKLELPYGIAIAAGALCVLPDLVTLLP